MLNPTVISQPDRPPVKGALVIVAVAAMPQYSPPEGLRIAADRHVDVGAIFHG
jgi:hypothetical protein